MTTNLTNINHLFIIDASFTSLSTKSNLISQVNDFLDSIRISAGKNLKHTHKITMMAIKNGRLKCLCHDLEIEQTPDFSITRESSSASTQLLDGIGSCIATWRALGHRRNEDGKHQVSIFTTGRDHGSRKYSICTLKTIIASLVSQGWNFTIIGANPLMPLIARNLNIPNYYNCSGAQSMRERNFLISRLKRQWQQQQIRAAEPNHSTRAA